MQCNFDNSTLSDRVTHLLREHILSGALPAGEPLKQEKLSGQFGISMGVLREALRTLHSDGLVTILPNRGASVSDLSASEAEEIFDIRTYLELGVLELALPRMTKKHSDAAKKILDRLEGTKDTSKWPELNRRFHEILYAAAERPKLMSMIGTMHDNVERYMRLYLDALNSQKLSQKEHRDLLEACCKKDLQEAQFVLRQHIGHARELLVQYLNSRDRS